MAEHDTQEPDQEEQRYNGHRDAAQSCIAAMHALGSAVEVAAVGAVAQAHAVLAQAAATMAVTAELKAFRAALADRPSPAAEHPEQPRCTWLSTSGWRCPLPADHVDRGLTMHTINTAEAPADLALYEQANGAPWTPREGRA